MTDVTEEIKAIFAKWRDPNHLQLKGGEMTAQEKRTVVAVLNAVEREVSAALPIAVAGERERAAKIVETSHLCRSCGQVFQGLHFSDECPAGFASLQGANREQVAAAIRADSGVETDG